MDYSFLKTKNNILCNGASIDSINQIQNKFNIRLPDTLSQFLQFSDGCLIDGRMIIFSCEAGVHSSERLACFNTSESVNSFLRIGRFSEDEFGYKSNRDGTYSPEIYLLNHETDETIKLASDLNSFIETFKQSRTT